MDNPALKPDVFRVEAQNQLTYKDLKIGVAGFYQETYTDAAGQLQNGLTAGLYIYHRTDRSLNRFITSYKGMKFTVGEYDVEVQQVELDPEGYGVVQLAVLRFEPEDT